MSNEHITDEQINKVVWEHTRLNPNQAADADLMLCIRNAFRTLISTNSTTNPSYFDDLAQCAQCKKKYRQGATSKGCPKCAPGSNISEAEFRKSLFNNP